MLPSVKLGKLNLLLKILQSVLLKKPLVVEFACEILNAGVDEPLITLNGAVAEVGRLADAICEPGDDYFVFDRHVMGGA